MQTSKLDGHAAETVSGNPAGDPVDQASEDHDDVAATVATVAVVGIGVAIWEAALLIRI